MPKCFPKVLPSSISVQMGIKATGFPAQIGESIDALTNPQNQTQQTPVLQIYPKFISING
jgi:hypothetical protein